MSDEPGRDVEEGDWTPGFPGQRPPFVPGNELAVKHGAYSRALVESPEVDERCASLRAEASWLLEVDETMLRAFVVTAMQFEVASSVTLPPPAEDGTVDVEAWATQVERRVTLSRDARGWLTQMRKLAHELGLTPAGRHAMEERERTVIFVADAQAIISAVFQAAG